MGSAFEILIDDADRLLERIEALGTSFSHDELAACLADVCHLTNASTSGLSLYDGTDTATLSGQPSDAVQTLVAENRLTNNTAYRIEQSNSTSMLVAHSAGSNSKVVLDTVFATADQCAELDDLMIALTEAFATVVQSHRLNQLEAVAGTHQQVGSFIRSLHGNRDAHQLANQIATDGATVIGVDRISVIRQTASRSQVLAVTGVADVNARANEIRFLQSIADHWTSIPREHRWLKSDKWADAAGCSDLAPQAIRHMRLVSPTSGEVGQGVSQTAHATDTAIFVLECFHKQPVDAASQTEVLDHANLAIQNAWAFDDRGLSGLKRRLVATSASRKFKWLLPIALLTVLALTLIPATFEIECRGNLQPVQQQFLLAPSHGRITSAATNEQLVQAGDSLLTIQNASLSLQASQLQGDLRTAEAKLKTLSAERGATTTPLISEAEVEEQIAGLTQQLAVLHAELKALNVTARFAGTVYVNDLTGDLVGTTVQPGQRLMHVVDPTGAWEVRLQIPDKVIRHVLIANNDAANDTAGLNVRMMLRTDPTVVFSGTLNSVAGAAEIDARNELSVPASVTFQTANTMPLRPGSEVLAKIDCGKRALGFVLFRETIEFIQRRILF